MERLLSSRLGDDLHALLLFHWLDVRSLVTLDIAVSSDVLRPYWMTLLRSLRAASIDNIDHSASSLIWLIQRGICTTRIQMKVNAWRVPVCDPSLLNTIGLLHLGLNGCKEVTDGCLMEMVNKCSLEASVEVTDAGVTALSHGCGQLQSINLFQDRKSVV